MPTKYTEAFHIVEYILKCILRIATVKVVLVCHVAKFVVNQMYKALERSANTKQDTHDFRKMQAAAREDTQQISIVPDEEEAGYPLRKTKSSTIFPAHFSLAMTPLERQPEQHAKQSKLGETRKTSNPELERLRFRRVIEEKRLERLQRKVEDGVAQLKNWVQLKESIPRLLEDTPTDMALDLPSAKACAAQNFPIREVQQRRALRKTERKLRSEIVRASNGEFQLHPEYKMDVPVEDRVLVLMSVLEYTCEVTFKRSKNRLKRMMEEEAKVEEEVDMRRLDSAVCFDYDAKENM
jgi:hypothetical protein